MLSSPIPVADGAPGIAFIVGTLNQLKDYYGALPSIRAAALRIVSGIATGDQAPQINALARFVRTAVHYVSDPLYREFIQTPDVLLLQIHEQGYAQGDCDDHCLLFAALAEAIGIPSTIVGVQTPGAAIPDHVIVTAHLEQGDLSFDLVAKGIEQPLHGLPVP